MRHSYFYFKVHLKKKSDTIFYSICVIVFLLQGSSENYVIVKDYIADTDGFTVNVGDIVEAVNHDDSAK